MHGVPKKVYAPKSSAEEYHKEIKEESIDKNARKEAQREAVKLYLEKKTELSETIEGETEGYICNICGYTSNSAVGIKIHKTKSHQDKNKIAQEEEELYCCPFCKIKTSWEGFRSHIEATHIGVLNNLELDFPHFLDKFQISPPHSNSDYIHEKLTLLENRSESFAKKLYSLQEGFNANIRIIQNQQKNILSILNKIKIRLGL